jgi:large subunit ribosomal protein L5
VSYKLGETSNEKIAAEENFNKKEAGEGKSESALEHALTEKSFKETSETEKLVEKEIDKSHVDVEKQEEIIESTGNKDLSKVQRPISDSMKSPKLGKVVINISTGQSGEPLERAIKILENLTNQRPCIRRAKQTIRTFGIRRNEPISCMVTLRGSKADEVLKMTLAAVGNRISPHNFDRNGNFAFGIKEHIDIPGQRYDPRIGITGMNVMATVERHGYRVSRKRRSRSKVGRSHRIKREESIEFIKHRYGVEVGIPSE